MRTLSLMLILTFAFFSLFDPIYATTTDIANPPKVDAIIYKYIGKDGVPVFTNNIESVPKPFRNQMTVLEVQPKATTTQTESVLRAGLNHTFIRNILIAIVAIVLFWIIKLWIKNMILKFIARLAIKIAIVGLIYMLAHQWFFSSEKVSFFKTVEKTIAPYKAVLPIDQATKGIKEFNKKEEQKKKTLEAIPQNP